MTKSLLHPTSPSSSLLSSVVNVIFTLFFLFFFQSEIVVVSTSSSSVSSAPVIGIVTQPWSNKKEGSYIAASYVKWLEAGGARSIAIPYDASNELVEDIFTQIDGILLTGGDNADISPALYHLWDLLLSSYDDEQNNNNDFMPLWGTCLGFQYLIQLGSESKHASFPPRPLFDAYTGVSDGESLPLEQVEQYHLYQNEDIYHAVQTHNITVNSHSLGITPQRFMEDDFLSHNYWKITSINNGDEVNHQKHPFVSTVEPIHPEIFPVYGVQFHPEKNPFEYGEVNVDHSKIGIDVSLYMSSFFIDLVRQNISKNRKNNGNGTGNGNGNGKYTKPDTYPLLYTYPIEHIGGYFEQKILIPPATTTVEDDTVNFEEETVGVVRSAHNINNNNNIISSSSDNDILSSMPPATTRTTTIASMLVGGMAMMVVVVVGSIVFMKQKPKCSYDSKKNRYENISNEGKDEQQ